MNYYPGELFEDAASMVYYERIEKIWEGDQIYKLGAWELDFVEDLYLNPREKYSEKQINVINRIAEKCDVI